MLLFFLSFFCVTCSFLPLDASGLYVGGGIEGSRTQSDSGLDIAQTFITGASSTASLIQKNQTKNGVGGSIVGGYDLPLSDLWWIGFEGVMRLAPVTYKSQHMVQGSVLETQGKTDLSLAAMVKVGLSFGPYRPYVHVGGERHQVRFSYKETAQGSVVFQKKTKANGWGPVFGLGVSYALGFLSFDFAYSYAKAPNMSTRFLDDDGSTVQQSLNNLSDHRLAYRVFIHL